MTTPPEPPAPIVGLLENAYAYNGRAVKVSQTGTICGNYAIIDLQRWYEGSALIETNASTYKPQELTIPLTVKVNPIDEQVLSAPFYKSEYNIAAVGRSVHYGIGDRFRSYYFPEYETMWQYYIDPKGPVHTLVEEIEPDTVIKALRYREHYAVMEEAMWISKSPTRSEVLDQNMTFGVAAAPKIPPLLITLDPERDQANLIVILYSNSTHIWKEDMGKTYTLQYKIPENLFTTDMRPSVKRAARQRFIQNLPEPIDPSKPIPPEIEALIPNYDGRWYLHIAQIIRYVPAFTPLDLKSTSGEGVLWCTAVPLHTAKGVVEFGIQDALIKMTVQEPPNFYSHEFGLNTPIYTDRIHVANIPGAVIPPYRLVGNVPKANYSINQIGASATLRCQWTNVSTLLTTVALPYTRTAAYKTSYERLRPWDSYWGIQ